MYLKCVRRTPYYERIARYEHIYERTIVELGLCYIALQIESSGIIHYNNLITAVNV